MANVWHMCGIVVNKKVCHWCVMAREDLHFRLRIPEDLKKQVEEAAQDNHRSMTAEIVARLEASFAKPDETGFDEHELSEAVKKAVLEVVAGKVGPVLTVRDMTTPKKNSMTRRPKD
jgi:hypothetical protein